MAAIWLCMVVIVGFSSDLVSASESSKADLPLNLYDCEDGTNVMVHLFEWRWDDIASECENFLGPLGYCAVQISPPSEHIVETNQEWRPWWERYQPVSYIMDSRSGNRAAFQDMVTRCHNAGIRIYVDAVINHMTGGGSGIGIAGSSWTTGPGLYGGESYPSVPYSQFDFNGPDECSTSDLEIHNYNDPVEVRNCRLLGLRDLKLASSYVRDKVIDFMNDCIDMGVAGFRVDACKHMWPGDLEVVYSSLNNLPTSMFPANTPPFVFQEVIDMGGEAISGDEYIGLGRVTEFKYGRDLSDCIRGTNGQRLAYLENFGEDWGYLHRLDSIVFVDNHDNQRDHGGGGNILTHMDGYLYRMGVGFMLAWDYSYPRVMSSYYFSDTEAGPPSYSDGTTKPVSCGDEWACEHRWRQIYNMVKFHNAVMGTQVTNWWDNGFHQIAFSRGGRGFVVMNNDNSVIDASFDTGMPEGEYCDVMTCDSNRPPCSSSSGYCKDPIYVDNSGWANIYLSHTMSNDNEEQPMIAIYV